jgi:pimeloyl-ACP methyl ester carboxylesterase
VKRAKDKAASLRELNRWMNGDIELSDEEVELVVRVFETYRQRLPRPGRLDDEQLRRITTPTLLLLSQDTVIFDPMKVAERAKRLLADVTVNISPNAGHGLLFQHPNQITAKILDFAANRNHAPADPPGRGPVDRPSG